ncbi:MAG: NADP-dependent phosphogluconate dehydrogenase [Bacteroidota bacterium]
MTVTKAEIGIIGLGVMGKSLALNFADKGFSVATYNRHVPGVEENIAPDFAKNHPEKQLTGVNGLSDFIRQLERPRKVFLMIKAGKAVDAVLEELIPILDTDDIIMDGGNSHFEDTERRVETAQASELHFLGVGVSGGEEGARNGPSLMPGGSKTAYAQVSDYLESIAADDGHGGKCCALIGSGGAGHFVKMTHNGVEYGEMQLISEIYYLMRYYAGMSVESIRDVFKAWTEGELSSYLLEITTHILARKEGGSLLLDKVLDKATQKGTGGWSTEVAIELGVPLTTISESVMVRMISAMKERRVKAASYYPQPRPGYLDIDQFIPRLYESYLAAKIINHHIGFELMKRASDAYSWQLTLDEVARVWTNGCIIRSRLMETLKEEDWQHGDILTSPTFINVLKDAIPALTATVAEALTNGYAVPVLSGAANYFLGVTTANSPSNLLQAQRDYFGAHRYERVDETSGIMFHSDWKTNN